jgi:hypothetical protein
MKYTGNGVFGFSYVPNMIEDKTRRPMTNTRSDDTIYILIRNNLKSMVVGDMSNYRTAFFYSFSRRKLSLACSFGLRCGVQLVLVAAFVDKRLEDAILDLEECSWTVKLDLLLNTSTAYLFSW